MKENIDALIGRRIAEARKNKNMTQAEVGRFFNSSPQRVSNWENGIKAVSIKNMLTLSVKFGVSLGYLACEHDYSAALRDAVFICNDDLMAPIIVRSDTVEINTRIKEPSEAAIFAIRKDGKVAFRWIRPNDMGAGYTMSVNSPEDWGSTQINSRDELASLNIIGRAVAVTRRL